MRTYKFFWLPACSILVGWLGFYWLCPKLHLSQFRYNADRFVSYSEINKIEEAIKDGDRNKADLLTADIIFNVSGKSKAKWIGKSDMQNFSCGYLLKIDDIWSRRSRGKFGFTTQARIWEENKTTQNPRSSEIEFKKAVGWDNKNSETSSYPKGYFPHEIYRQGSPLAVPFSSEKLHSCQQI
jgi:hypothetical protein